MLNVDVGAEPSTAGGGGGLILVERCSEVARMLQSVPLRVAVQANRLNSSSLLLLPLWACTGCTAPQMISGFRPDSYRVRPTLYSRNIPGNLKRLTQEGRAK